jgi:hypothetical protein
MPWLGVCVKKTGDTSQSIAYAATTKRGVLNFPPIFCWLVFDLIRDGERSKGYSVRSREEVPVSLGLPSTATRTNLRGLAATIQSTPDVEIGETRN